MSKEKRTPSPRHKTEQPHDTADKMPASVPVAEDVLAKREAAVHTQEQAIFSREEAADQRDKVTEHEAKTRDTQRALTEAQLREANEHLVVATVRARTMADVAEQTSVQMSHMAKHDFLTGLPNRMLLTDRLAQAISLARRHGKKVALMFLDIDHFKHINDSLGHEVGDRLLQSAAKRLQGCVRLSDTVSRLGGDEFIVLLPEVDELQGAVLTAEKLIEAMAEPHIIGDHQLHISLSIGISLYPDDGSDAETVIRNADIAMYHAKQSGRNNYQVFTPAFMARTAARQTVEQGLQQALDQGGFFIHYQPKVNLETGAITGAEALLRWKRSDHCLAGPTEFMNIAETSGLILQIGRWVLQEVCRQTQFWLQAGLKLGQVAVNISAREFLGRDFLSDVSAVLNDTGLDPHHLEIELTECILMHDTQQTTATLLALKELGVQIAIDDFGTGYSSLSNLWSFPIDTLKIDQSFVQDIDGEAGEAIVSTIIAMGKSLKQRVVAEGIETQEQLAVLQSLRCAEGQGYHFGRPVAAEEFAALLQAAGPQLC